MKIDVRHVADLAKLKLTEDELVAMEKDLEMILAHIERLAGVQVEGVEPTFGSREPEALRLQGDDPRPGCSRASMLELAPSSKDGYYVVPARESEGRE
ncbi:MAG TPA: Asp-tRNA(Asn)/Glu-tRNA(Gln) amidotransferase subunit GatC [Firmicutes bacterium]|nr:Asp-tRNA(Asn)/Glu-tRNA(Gln) amidotransferase subunit GatC [Candidatus Fermentithermobacillaceae bacterium]